MELFEKEPFDLVIVDYAMPEMQGGELALHIRRIVPSQPIVMVTAYYEQVVGAEMPVDAIISKPFGVDALRQAMAKLLR